MRSERRLPLGSVLLAWLLILCAGNRGWAVLEVRDTGQYVIDTAGVLDAATRERLNNLLRELEQKTTDQVKVLTVSTTEPEDVFTFSQRTYTNWKLGTKKKSNGALIVLAVKDRKVRIHTGYGVEGSLPDQWIGTLSREIAGKYFRAGKYAEGLNQMTLSVVNKLADDAGVKITGLPKAKIMPAVSRPPDALQIFMFLLPLVIMLLFIWYAMRRSRSRRYWGLPGRNIEWGSGPWTSSGGGWSSGGGGSWGGGGGSFGGGGSSGGGGGGASW